MHIRANDENGNAIPVNESESKKQYTCIWCGAKMHARKPQNRHAHYVLYPNEVHKNRYCRARAESNIVYVIDNKDSFFSYLTEEPKSPKRRGKGKRTPPGVDDIDVIDIDDDDDDGNRDEVTNDDLVVANFRTLKQLWDYCLNALQPEDPESHSDIVIFENWYNSLFRAFNGGNMVIQARPDYIGFEKREIHFKCEWIGNWYDKESHQKKESTFWRTFILSFRDDSTFFRYKDILKFKKEEMENGASTWRSNCGSVLIAGKWEKDVSNRYSYHTLFINKRQLYVIDE